MNARLVSFALAALVGLPLGASAADVTADNLTVNRDAVFQGNLTVGQGQTGAAPTNGLVLYYSFSQSALPVADDSGKGHFGIVTGATWAASGVRGPCYYFDGNDEMYAANPVYSNGIVNWSMFCWVKFASVTNTPFRILYFGNPNTTGQALILYVEVAGPRFALDLPNTGGPRGSIVPTTNTWYFIGATSSNRTVQVYINGAASGTAVSLPGMNYSNATLMQKIGSYWWGELHGWVDEVRLYDRTLSSTEVGQLYSNEVSSASAAVRFTTGVQHVAPLGDLGMGTFTNRP